MIIKIPFKNSLWNVQSNLILHLYFFDKCIDQSQWKKKYYILYCIILHFISGSEVNLKIWSQFSNDKRFASTTVTHRALCLPADTYNFLVISSTIICFMFTRKCRQKRESRHDFEDNSAAVDQSKHMICNSSSL